MAIGCLARRVLVKFAVQRCYSRIINLRLKLYTPRDAKESYVFNRICPVQRSTSCPSHLETCRATLSRVWRMSGVDIDEKVSGFHIRLQLRAATTWWCSQLLRQCERGDRGIYCRIGIWKFAGTCSFKTLSIALGQSEQNSTFGFLNGPNARREDFD